VPESVLQKILQLASEYGPLGLLILVLAWILRDAIPHIVRGYVEDRKDKRYHKRELKKFRAVHAERRQRRARSQKSKRRKNRAPRETDKQEH
jgi:hypothetical protein